MAVLLRDGALSHGLHDCWTTPILSAHKRVLGSFAMYRATQPGPEVIHRLRQLLK